MQISFRRFSSALAALFFATLTAGQTPTPEIAVLGAVDHKSGGGIEIPSGDTTPNTTDGTDMGAVSACCGSTSKSFWIWNAGDTVLKVSLPITITGPNAGDFSVLQPPASALSAKATMQFGVDFRPKGTGVRTATVTIYSDDADENPYTFTIQGTAQSSGVEFDLFGNDIPIPNGDTTPSEADGTDFGSATIAGGSVYHSFTMRTTGSAPTGGFGGFYGANAADFAVVSQTSSSISGGTSTTYKVRFAPVAGPAGVRTATGTFGTNDDDENPYTFTVQGTAVEGGAPAPEIEVRNHDVITSGDTTPSAEDGTAYGEVAIGGYGFRTFEIQNIGGAMLNVGNVTLSGSPTFTVDPQPTLKSVPVHGSFGLFSIWFMPTDTTMQTATVTIPNDDPDENPFVFTVSGTGVVTTPPPIAVTGHGETISHASTTTSMANGTNFGDVPVGTPGTTETYTVTNVGSEPLALMREVVVAVNGDFRITAQPSFASLAPGASTSFQVNFRPSTTGPRRGIVMIRSDNPSPSYFTFFVSGNGVAQAGAPVINGVNSVVGSVGTAFSYQINATNSPTSYSATGLPPGLSVNPAMGVISGTPATAGRFDVQLGATNSSGTGNQLLSITIADGQADSPTKTTPTITFSSPVSAVTVGVPIALGATSNAGLPIVYSVVSGNATLQGTTLTPNSTATLVVRAATSATMQYNSASTEVNFGNPQKAAQTISASSTSQTVKAGSTVTLDATSTSGLPVTYSVMSGPGTVDGNRLTLTGSSGTVFVRAAQAGSDTFAAASDVTLRFDIVPVPISRLVNISSRLRVSANDGGGASIAGFVIAGSSPKQMLIRGVGPTLANYGIGNPLSNPQLKLYNGDRAVIATNAGWNEDPQIAAAATTVGAFNYNAGSKDAALLVTLSPGAYTAQIQSNGSGTALIEVYDVAAATTATKQLINISTRGTVGSGDDVLIGGFVITGDQPKRVLIRGIGPKLADFGVNDALTDPLLTLYDGKQAVIARNDNWGAAQPMTAGQSVGTGAEIVAASAATGAFPLTSGSADAALLVTLAPGAYSAVVTGANNAHGAAMVEIYEVPE